MNVKVTMLGSL